MDPDPDADPNHAIFVIDLPKMPTKSNFHQGVKKICRLSWQTNSALVYEHKSGGRGGGVAASQPMSATVHRSTRNVGDLTPYLTYGFHTETIVDSDENQ